MINSSSTSSFVPIPEHSAQAPNGELNEKDLGSSSSKDISQSAHAICSLKLFSLSGEPAFKSTKSKITKPDASLNAVSIESVIRDLLSSFTESRSTTTSIVCFSCFFNLGTSAIAYTFPSTLTRAYP
ncbi:unannotated protein [freshwater metagenome]|uniref:Unannotated protein n=1 Tax=freshwater metagenome TaxID=449393 RepID=A0A6J7W5K1_9ZZZZ